MASGTFGSTAATRSPGPTPSERRCAARAPTCAAELVEGAFLGRAVLGDSDERDARRDRRADAGRSSACDRGTSASAASAPPSVTGPGSPPSSTPPSRRTPARTAPGDRRTSCHRAVIARPERSTAARGRRPRSARSALAPAVRARPPDDLAVGGGAIDDHASSGAFGLGALRRDLGRADRLRADEDERRHARSCQCGWTRRGGGALDRDVTRR